MPVLRKHFTCITLPSVQKGYIRFGRCCVGLSKKKTGFAPPRLAWRM
jgi:hypothetical protein